VGEKKVSIHILGSEYVISGDVDNQTTRSVAHYVEQQIEQAHHKNSSQNKLKTAIISNMNVAGKLFETQKMLRKLESESQQYTRVIESMVNKLDAALDDDNHDV
jgi:cell division protein ZapA (FtsZ GTPase activity inhibitor)